MNDQLMIFSETNIYILSKLVALVRRETGTRHRLSTDDAIKKLLLDASRSSDGRIKSHYFRFLENLTTEQLVSFKEYGLTIPAEYLRKQGLMPTPITRKHA